MSASTVAMKPEADLQQPEKKLNESRPLCVRKCDRCGAEHLRLVFTPFSKRDIGRWTHWALCPVLQEPLVMRLVESSFDRFNGAVIA